MTVLICLLLAGGPPCTLAALVVAAVAWMITGILFYFHQLGVLKVLSGSQMAVWYYRAMGAKIGKGVLLNSLAR